MHRSILALKGRALIGVAIGVFVLSVSNHAQQEQSGLDVTSPIPIPSDTRLRNLPTRFGSEIGPKSETRFTTSASDDLTKEPLKYRPRPDWEQKSSEADDDKMMGVMGKGTEKIKLGGHIGFVVPITGRGNGSTSSFLDRFTFGFPVGLTVKTPSNIAVDFEFIPTFNTGRDFVLTIHPGVLYGFKKKYAVGVRAAYDAGNASFGFTPLIARGFKINGKLGWFIEADFPVRSNYRPYSDRFISFAVAAHSGITF